MHYPVSRDLLQILVRRTSIYFLAGSFIVPSLVSGAGDPVQGRDKALICSQCHGVGGNSADAKIPKLAGQRAEYIVQETLEFQQGTRRDPMMSGMSALLQNPQDLEDIAAYYASQPPMHGRATDINLVKQGAALFSDARCNYCHGDGGKRFAPFPSYPPVIGGQHKTYLIKALRDIKLGTRPGDVYNMMQQTLAELSDQDFVALAEYLNSL